MNRNLLAALSTAIFAAACTNPPSTSMESNPENTLSQKEFGLPPVAKKVAHETAIHDLTLQDDYFWMRLSDEQKEATEPDAQTQDVLDYLIAENDYRAEVMKSTEALQDSLYEEIVGRIKQDDASVPIKDNHYWYYTRYEEGKEYAIHCRKLEDMEAEESIMLNVNEMAEGFAYYDMGGINVSPDNQLVVFGVDKLQQKTVTQLTFQQ